MGTIKDRNDTKLTEQKILRGGKNTQRKYTKKDVLFIIGDWNAKVGSQEIPGVTGKFGFATPCFRSSTF